MLLKQFLVLTIVQYNTTPIVPTTSLQSTMLGILFSPLDERPPRRSCIPGTPLQRGSTPLSLPSLQRATPHRLRFQVAGAHRPTSLQPLKVLFSANYREQLSPSQKLHNSGQFLKMTGCVCVNSQPASMKLQPVNKFTKAQSCYNF